MRTQDGRTSAFAAALGHDFARPELLEQALTHRSASPGRGVESLGYERLEFLGDRVLGLIVAELLLARYPEEDEGRIARRYAALVRRESLVRVAGEIDLGRHLRLSPGEAGAGGRESPALLADACEAVIAALYLDGGLAAARAFVERHWAPLMEEAAAPPSDAKTALQEWAQARRRPLPEYRILEEHGPAHAPEFLVEARVEGLPPATGRGRSKRAAEQAAAAAVLAEIGEDE